MAQEVLQRLIADLSGLDRTELQALREAATDALQKTTPSGVLAQYKVLGGSGEEPITYRLRLTSCGRLKCKRCGGVRPGHGPWWYSSQKVNNKYRLKYIGKHLPDDVMSKIPELRGKVIAPVPEQIIPEPIIPEPIIPEPTTPQRKIGRRAFGLSKTTTATMTTSHAGAGPLLVVKAGPGPKLGETVTVYPDQGQDQDQDQPQARTGT